MGAPGVVDVTMLSYPRWKQFTYRLKSMSQRSESAGEPYRKSIKIKKMVGPEGLEPSTNRL
ncbi:hypothetical protein NOR51B_198 [Luminiphilus syltensis NOR5-1B]|uniref:Uncharacterized protein n=1 Tax=Luminiphilus syltensis NOR5-1B TaxID=565045 RepID=B8KVV6_9GAMM|nr:hypothetical protein NOR51B_198 [Luminiphilus syltensis NOR5-1B]